MAAGGDRLKDNGEIVLAVSHSANSGECGSCHFFRRPNDSNEYDNWGTCTFRLPPKIERLYAYRQFKENEDSGRSAFEVKDTEGCDLWRSSGKTYIVSQRVKP